MRESPSSGMFVVLAASLLVASLLACGGPQERICPAPIGRIVLEDCDVYQRRFEALSVDLRVLLGTSGGRVSVERAPSRAPARTGEALDVLAHRLHALCKDHNACRVAPDARSAARERLDVTVTALSTLRDRLRAEDDPAARAVLTREIERILTAAAGVDAPEARRHYSSWLPWFGAVHRPPQPDPPVGAPYLVDVDFDTSARFAAGKGIVGYGPRARVDLWWPGGRFAADDAIVMHWAGGVVTDCPIRGRGNGDDHASVGCHAPKDFVSTADVIEVGIGYRTGIDGVEHPIGRATGRLVSDRVDGPDKAPTWDVDLDPIARSARLVWRPVGRTLPSDADRPSLWVVLKLRDYAKPTLRCGIGDEDLFGALGAGRSSGQAGTHQDRPRYRRVKPNSSVSVRHPFIEWWRFDFPLPFVVPRSADEVPEGDARWPRAGAWACTVTLDGEPVRRLRFNVRPDGALDMHPEQLAMPRPYWLVETEVVPSSVEEPLR